MDQEKINFITKEFKRLVKEKYNIIEVKLFGSSVRDDHTKYSDIDIMIKLPKVTREIEEDLFAIAYDLELEYECLIDVIAVPEDFNITIPIYEKIEREGIVI